MQTVRWGTFPPLCVKSTDANNAVYCLGATPAEGLASLRVDRAMCGLTALDVPFNCSLTGLALPIQTQGIVPVVPPDISSQAVVTQAVVPVDVAAAPAEGETRYSLVNPGTTAHNQVSAIYVAAPGNRGCDPRTMSITPLFGPIQKLCGLPG